MQFFSPKCSSIATLNLCVLALLASGCTQTKAGEYISSLTSNKTAVHSHVLVDRSGSALASDEFPTLIDNVCKGIKEDIKTDDRLTLIPYAAESTVTHTIQIDDRLTKLGMCKDQNFTDLLDQHRGVDTVEGTNLQQTLAQLKPDVSSSPTDEGNVILLLAHADDQGVGAQNAIPLAETAAIAEELLSQPNAVLVVFAVDGQLQRDLKLLLQQHPQARVSALSEGSIADSLDWAYRTARSPSAQRIER